MPAGLWPAGNDGEDRRVTDQKLYFAPTVKKRPTAPD